MQSASDDLPSFSKYVSTGQSLHLTVPLPSWKRPGGQLVQLPGALPYVPISQGEGAEEEEVKLSPNFGLRHFVDSFEME